MEQIGESEASREVFLGGPPQFFDSDGREQLAVLLQHGLVPSSMLCDVGCGALRGGRWTIPLLDPGHYCGIEPSADWLDYGLEHFVEPAVRDAKQPRFDHNLNFDMSVFGERFTHVILRSIWTHADKQQIGQSLDSFRASAAPEAVMLSSILPRAPWRRDYKGEGWVGRSHECDVPGMVSHSFRWLYQACESRGLKIVPVARRPYCSQFWLRVTLRDRAGGA